MPFYELTDHFVVAASVERTWSFFSSAANLPRITPPWLGFRIVTPEPIRIENDALLDYTIKWFGVPIRWRTKIIDWQPPHRFIDLQVRGPYTLWHHQHAFTPTAEGVACTDRVIYKVPVPGVGRAVNALVVRKQLLEIFRFRRRVIGEDLGWVRAAQDDVRIAAVKPGHGFLASLCRTAACAPPRKLRATNEGSTDAVARASRPRLPRRDTRTRAETPARPGPRATCWPVRVRAGDDRDRTQLAREPAERLTE